MKRRATDGSRRFGWWTESGRLDRFVLVVAALWAALYVHIGMWVNALPWAALTAVWALLMGAQVNNVRLRVRVKELERAHRAWIRDDLRRRGLSRRHHRGA